MVPPVNELRAVTRVPMQAPLPVSSLGAPRGLAAFGCASSYVGLEYQDTNAVTMYKSTSTPQARAQE